MKKARIVKLQQLIHIQSEVMILSRLRSIFAIQMKALFQDENSIYLLQEYVPGGELFSHLRKAKTFELSLYQFYSLEVACALHYLHQLNIVYRDLKPENILLTKAGHIKLSEFSLAKQITPLNGNSNNSKSVRQQQTFTLCGTPEYLAPELIEGKGYGTSIDWWALGILLFEMVMGYPPFFGKNPFTVYQKILDGKINIADGVHKHTKSVIKGLLNAERKQRLACSSFDSLKNHAFYKGMDNSNN